ncbi:MAG: hypothetical protein ACPKPY_09070 [Nitrososphaeraceae archaeon]
MNQVKTVTSTSLGELEIKINQLLQTELYTTKIINIQYQYEQSPYPDSDLQYSAMIIYQQ